MSEEDSIEINPPYRVIGREAWIAASSAERAKEHQRLTAAVEKKYAERLKEVRATESKNAVDRLRKKLIAHEVKELNKACGDSNSSNKEKSRKRKRNQGNMLGLQLGNKQPKMLLRQANAAAVKHGACIAVDLAFASDALPQRTRSSLMKQMGEIHHHNTVAAHPAKIVLCGVPDRFRNEFQQRYHFENWQTQGTFKVTKDDLFQIAPDKQGIVYMSSDASADLESVEPGKTFVIGGILDHNSQKGVTQAKAEALQVESRCLPLDAYLDRRGRSHDCKKVLTCNAVAQILLDVSVSSDWDFALDRHLPFRSHKNDPKGTNNHHNDRVSWGNRLCPKPRLALVLGASAGLGLAFATELRERGWSVALVARDPKRLENTAQRLRKEVSPKVKSNEATELAPLVVTIAGDCSQRADCLRIARAVDALGLAPAVDGIVACAGTFKWDSDPALQSDPELLQTSNLLTKSTAMQDLFLLLDMDLRYFQGRQDPFVFSIVAPGERDNENIETSIAASEKARTKRGFFICVGSDAGKPDFAQRVKDAEHEQKYIRSMQDVAKWFRLLHRLLSSKAPGMVLKLLEPPLIATEMAKEQFKKLDIDWSTVPEPRDYVKSVLENDPVLKKSL